MTSPVETDPVEDDRLAEARQAGAWLPAALRADSTPLRWQDVLVRTYVDEREAPVFETRPTGDALLVLVLAGSGVIESRHGASWQRAVYRPGSLGVTAPGGSSTLRWRTTSRQPMLSAHIHLSQVLVSETAATLRTRSLLPDQLELTDQFSRASARQLTQALEAGVAGLYADTLAQALTGHLLHLAHRTSPPSRPAAGLGPSALRDVVAVMHARLAEQVTLEELASVAHLSRHHFLRQFKAATGTTPYRMLGELRMARAAELLRSGRSPLSTALAVGYRSPSRFAEAFRRAHGDTPAAYQQHHS